jgi:gas vesicle protein
MKYIACSLFLFTVLALPNPQLTISITGNNNNRAAGNSGYFGSNSLTQVATAINQQVESFQQNYNSRNYPELKHNIDRLKKHFTDLKKAFSSNSNFSPDVMKELTNVYWNVPRLLNDYRDYQQKDYNSDLMKLRANTNNLLGALNANNNGNLPPWSPRSMETARHVQSEIRALNEKINQGNWNYVDENIQNLKNDKQKISISYLNNESISRDSRSHAQNLDNAIDSILNHWNTSRDHTNVSRDAALLVNYVNLLLKSLNAS